MKKAQVPVGEQVVELRSTVQRRLGLGITAAQDWCAAAVHTSRRAWQQWESGDRGMHAAFWELARIKVDGLSVSKPTTTKGGRGSAPSKRRTVGDKGA